jgi:hypothetical protein
MYSINVLGFKVGFEDFCNKESLKIPKRGNENPYIEEEQTTQWPKQKSIKVRTTIYKTHT